MAKDHLPGVQAQQKLNWQGAGMGRLVGGGGRVGWEGHLPNIAKQRTEDSELGGDLHKGSLGIEREHYHFLKHSAGDGSQSTAKTRG